MAFYKTYTNSFGKPSFSMPLSGLGAPTSPLVAKQLEEFSKSLNQGIKNVEIGTISADKFEFIPIQHFEEIRRIAKLTDSKVSVHAPLLDLAGFPAGGEGGGRWREEQRKTSEEQVFSILERTQKMSNGENVPVVFHAGHTFSQEYEKGLQRMSEREKIIDGKKIIVEELVPSDIRAIAAVNAETGEVTRLDYEEKFHVGKKGLGKDGAVVWDPFTRLDNLNGTQWDEEKIRLLSFEKDIEDLREKLNLKVKQNEAIEKSGLINNEDYGRTYALNKVDVDRMQSHIHEIHNKLYSSYNDVYNKFMQHSTPEQKKEFEEKHRHLKKNFDQNKEELESIGKQLRGLREAEKRAKSEEEKRLLKQKEEETLRQFLDRQVLQSKIVVTDMAEMPTPQIWKPVGEFAIEKTAETVSGALAKMYTRLKKEGKEKETPFIALENFFVNSPMSRAEDLRKAVEMSQQKLQEKLTKDYKIPEKEAKKAAEALIAATWDVGHINNLRKAGWEGEELKKQVLKETEHIADLVRHVHITDNFGFHDSHLPPGMGNVPIREIMEQLEKKWAQLEKEGKLKQQPRSIVEAGGFVAEIGANPTVGILEFFGSPLYKMGPSPYWGGKEVPMPHRAGMTYTPYTEAFIEFPQQHFNMYGSSFTTLPKSLGGQVGGEASRFSGTPNQ